MLPLLAMIALPALATPRLHSAHVRDNGDGTSSLVITADGPDAVDISTATARIATGEALTLLPERTFVEGTVVVPVSKEEPRDDDADIVWGIYAELMGAEGEPPVTWISGGLIVPPGAPTASTVPGLHELGVVYGAPPADGGPYVESAVLYGVTGSDEVQISLRLAGEGVEHVARAVVTVSSDSRLLMPLMPEVGVDLGAVSVDLAAPLAIGALPHGGEVVLTVAAMDGAGAMLGNARIRGAVRRFVMPDGTPTGVALMPIGDRAPVSPRGDILIGGEPIDFE